jgi:hypothetical protein
MWITEVREKITGKLLGRVEHGSNYNNANWAHSSYMFRFAAHRVHLIWEE